MKEITIILGLYMRGSFLKYDFNELIYQVKKRPAGNVQFYVARDGTKLFYREIKGSSDDHIFVIHGSGTDSRYLSSLSQSLQSNLQSTVIAVDLRGHGRNIKSTELARDCSYIGQLDNDLDDLIEHFKHRHSLSSIVLLGHSMGASFALRYAEQKPNKITGLILLAPYTGFLNTYGKPFAGGWFTLNVVQYMTLFILNKLHINDFNYKKILTFNRPAHLQNGYQVNNYSYRLYKSLQPQKFKKSLINIETPTLVLAGELDESLYTNRVLKFFKRKMRNVTVMSIPRTGHINLVFSDKACDVIKAWAKKLLNDHNLSTTPTKSALKIERVS